LEIWSLSAAAAVEQAAQELLLQIQAAVVVVEHGIQTVPPRVHQERNRLNQVGAAFTDLAIQEIQQAATVAEVVAPAALVGPGNKTEIMAVWDVTIASPALKYYVAEEETAKQTLQVAVLQGVIHGAAAAALMELEHIPVAGHKVQAAVEVGITEVVPAPAAVQA
jgi:hypothetical protein